MPIINNSNLTKEIIDGAKINIVTDEVPGQLARAVVPVMEVNPKIVKCVHVSKDTSKSTTGQQTVYTTPANKEFFLTAAVLEGTKDVNSDGTVFEMYTTGTDGATIRILAFLLQTLTAASDHIELNFNPPIRIPSSTAIVINHAFTAGTQQIRGIIHGFLLENA